MKVIKAVRELEGRKVSTFARGKWQKEYAERIETKPDFGYLFAYSEMDLERAKIDMGEGREYQFWLAKAKVVGRIGPRNITVHRLQWSRFWADLKLQLRSRGAEYLLCSSVTLVKRLA